MELRWPWLVVVLVALVVLALVVALRAGRPRGRDAVLVAHAARLRGCRATGRWSAASGACWPPGPPPRCWSWPARSCWRGRLRSVGAEPEVRNRDIMLCLDVSGSMDRYNRRWSASSGRSSSGSAASGSG